MQPTHQTVRSEAEGGDKSSVPSSPVVYLSEADRLNGNNQQPSHTATIQSHPQRPPGSPVLATVKSRPTPPPKPPLYNQEDSASSNHSKNGSSGGSSTTTGTSKPSTTNSPSSSSSSSSTSFYSSSVNATTNQARTMGSILKGSVMDKVTHVFNSTTAATSASPTSVSSSSPSTTSSPSNSTNMGNANNKDGVDSLITKNSGIDDRNTATKDLKPKDRRTSTPEISSTSSGVGPGLGMDPAPPTTSAINIPKGSLFLIEFPYDS